MPSHFRKMRIGGVKISDELLRIHFAGPMADQTRRLCRILAEEKVAILFLTVDQRGGDMGTSCCVALEHEDRVRTCLRSETGLEDRARFTRAVGLLSMYPHQNQLEVLGASLHALSKVNLTIYDLSSSLAALTFVLKYRDLESALNALGGYFVFPSDPARVRSTIRVLQT